MAQDMMFADRASFRQWLFENCPSGEGVWLVFGKPGGPKTVSPGDALEEALCFGWIDGQIRSIDDASYAKYFAQRRVKSEWSAKNIALVEKLEAAGKMTEFGRAKVEEAKREGRYQPKERLEITKEHVDEFAEKIKGFDAAYANFMAMSPSVQRTYTGYSLDTKSDEAAKRRLEKIVDRLNRNLKPM